MVTYSKRPLTVTDQAQQLVDRGMVGSLADIEEKLETVSYYRLSAYWYKRRISDTSLVQGTPFDDIWQLYVFDRRLRLLLLDAVERIEVAIRTMLVNRHCEEYGSGFAYASQRSSLPLMTLSEYNSLICGLRGELVKSKEEFVSSYRTKYGDEQSDLPLWMAAEQMTFGQVSRFYHGCADSVADPIAAHFGVHRTVFGSWVLCLSYLRNLCAHHCRLWNRELANAPKVPDRKNAPDWWCGKWVIQPKRLYAALCVCQVCLKVISPKSQWKWKLSELLKSYPRLNLREMGIPADWREHALWR